MPLPDETPTERALRHALRERDEHRVLARLTRRKARQLRAERDAARECVDRDSKEISDLLHALRVERHSATVRIADLTRRVIDAEGGRDAALRERDESRFARDALRAEVDTLKAELSAATERVKVKEVVAVVVPGPHGRCHCLAPIVGPWFNVGADRTVPFAFGESMSAAKGCPDCKGGGLRPIVPGGSHA